MFLKSQVVEIQASVSPDPSMIMWPSDRPGAGLRTHRSGGTKAGFTKAEFQRRSLLGGPDRIKPGTINRDVAHIIDLLPTCVELGEGEYPGEFQGNDILPVEGLSMVSLLNGKSRAGHKQLCWQWSGNRAIRQGDWKLVWDKLNKDKKWELYNLATDRCEIDNLADQYPKRVDAMTQSLVSVGRKGRTKCQKIAWPKTSRDVTPKLS